MRKTLRVRLTFWYVGALAAVLLAFSVAFYSLLEQSLRRRLDESLRAAAEVTALSLNHETEEHSGRAAGEENMRMVLNTMHQTSFPRPDIAVWDGERLVGEKPGTAGLDGPDTRVLAIAPGPSRPDGRAVYHTVTVRGVRYRAAVAGVWVPASRTSYRVVATEELQPVEAELATVFELLLVTVPVALLLAAAGGYFLARKSLRPVLDMARAADQISSHNLGQRLPVSNPSDELGMLAETFNRLFERLEDTFRQQRQFMADASHELRTPVSVALTAAQVSLEQRDEAADSPYETLEVVQAQMLRLRRVVEDMFTLAQADAGVRAAVAEPVYLDELLEESLRAARILAQARGVEIRVGEIAAEAGFTGDEGLLRQLMLILLDNAVKYTPAGGMVEASLRVAGGGYRLEVADTGAGIPEAHQPHIFDRFYRVDRSRSRREAGAGSGAGLGLAIADWIVRLHQGRIWLERSSSAGSLFCVMLPGHPPVPAVPQGSGRGHVPAAPMA